MINKKLDEEEKWKIILEQCEKDPLVKKVVANAFKKQKIEKELLPNKDLVESLISVAKLTNFVSDIEAKHYFKDPEYNEIYKKVKKSFLSNTIDSELIKLYNRNRSPVIKRINYFIRKYERKIYGKKYSEIQTLKKSDKSDKEEIIQSIKKSHFNDPLYEKIISLEFEKEQLRKFPYSTADIKSPISVSGDPLFLQKYYSLKILKPEVFVRLYQYEKKYEKFPFKWLRHLTVPQYRYIYERFKKGTLREDFILYEVNADGFFDVFFKNSQCLPFFMERKRFVEQIIENHRAGRYASAINLILPLIESFFWVFAAYIHKHEKQRIFKRLRLKSFWDFNKRSFKNLVLISTSGNEMKKPKIRKLISETHLKNYLPEEVVEYYVKELFEERNPILHGNSVDYDTEVNSAKKIICLNNLIHIFIEEITNIELPSKKRR
ncbi:MAG: hypothetical protein KAT65_05475 [Methanophagales archaeon]|nr:hypothetical protein [Methanophagales archaeon]